VGWASLPVLSCKLKVHQLSIWHPAYFHAGIFPLDISQSVFEGGFDPESITVPDLLTHNIKSAFDGS
jgi:hypothetical protein